MEDGFGWFIRIHIELHFVGVCAISSNEDSLWDLAGGDYADA